MCGLWQRARLAPLNHAAEAAYNLPYDIALVICSSIFNATNRRDACFSCNLRPFLKRYLGLGSSENVFHFGAIDVHNVLNTANLRRLAGKGGEVVPADVVHRELSAAGHELT